jgi:hypothetical protein
MLPVATENAAELNGPPIDDAADVAPTEWNPSPETCLASKRLRDTADAAQVPLAIPSLRNESINSKCVVCSDPGTTEPRTDGICFRTVAHPLNWL